MVNFVLRGLKVDTIRKKFLPVVHCVGLEFGGAGHAFVNAKIAFGNGADGIFLIGHNVSASDMLYLYENVRKQYPDKWIGINFLDLSLKNLPSLLSHVKQCVELNALWTDQMPVMELKQSLPSRVELFGGIAFEYLNPNPTDDELAVACVKIKEVADVATTSGNYTGVAPTLDKLAKIRRLIGDMPLAVASGISMNNISTIGKIADNFIVATSVSEPKQEGSIVWEYLIPQRIQMLARFIHSFNMVKH